MKKQFEKPIMQICVFSVNDIITESGDTGAAVKAKKALNSAGVSDGNIFSIDISGN